MWSRLRLCLLISDFALLWSSFLTSSLNTRPLPFTELWGSLGLHWEKGALTSAITLTVTFEGYCFTPHASILEADPVLFLENILLWKISYTYKSREKNKTNSYEVFTSLQHLLIQRLNIFSPIPPPHVLPNTKLFLYESVQGKGS